MSDITSSFSSAFKLKALAETIFFFPHLRQLLVSWFANESIFSTHKKKLTIVYTMHFEQEFIFKKINFYCAQFRSLTGQLCVCRCKIVQN